MDRNNKKQFNLSLFNIGIGTFLIIILVVYSLLNGIEEDKKTFDNFVEAVKETKFKTERAYKLNNAGYKRGYVQYQMILTDDAFERDELYSDYHRYAYEIAINRKDLISKATIEEKALLDDQLNMIKITTEIQDKIEAALANDNLKLAGSLRQKAYSDGIFKKFFSTSEILIELQKIAEQDLLLESQRQYEITASKTKKLLILTVIIITLLAFYVLFNLYKKEKRIQKAVLDLKRSSDEYEYMSLHDNLTQLPNRFYLYKKISEIILEIVNNDRELFVIFFDLDGFKGVNDNLGHEAGDELLQQIATRLNDDLSKELFISRVGGDEFIILATVDKNSCIEIAQQVLDLLCKPFELRAGTANIGTSIGISEYLKNGNSSDELVKTADTAMYISKKSGGNNYHFASEKDKEKLNKMDSTLRSSRSKSR